MILGGFLDRSLRYDRAGEFITAARTLWDSWADDAVVADAARGVFVADESITTFHHQGDEFSISGELNVPRSPQGWIVQIQAGDSDGGRELAAEQTDVIFSRHSGYADGQAFYTDVKRRLAKYGRTPDDLKIIPAAVAFLGDTEDDAIDKARHIRLQQVSPQGAIAFLEQVWGRDLSSYDPDGPMPDIDPDTSGATSITRGRVRHEADSLAVANKWREIAARKQLSIRELIIEVTTRSAFIGTPRQVAETINRYVQDDAADGYIFVPHITPHGLDEFVDKVVPELQEMGVFRTVYEGTTLRDHLGLRRPPSPVGSAGGTGSARLARSAS